MREFIALRLEVVAGHSSSTAQRRHPPRRLHNKRLIRDPCPRSNGRILI